MEVPGPSNSICGAFGLHITDCTSRCARICFPSQGQVVVLLLRAMSRPEAWAARHVHQCSNLGRDRAHGVARRTGATLSPWTAASGRLSAHLYVADANNMSASTAKPPSPRTRSGMPTNVAIAATIHGRGAPRLACLVAKVCCCREVALWWWSMKRASRHHYPDCLGAFGAALRLTTVCPPTLVALASELPLRIRTFPAQDIPDGLCAGDIWQGV